MLQINSRIASKYNFLLFTSCVYIGTHIKVPGVIEKGRGAAKIFTGYNKEDKLCEKTLKIAEFILNAAEKEIFIDALLNLGEKYDLDSTCIKEIVI